jgi:endoglycosylceramidase
VPPLPRLHADADPDAGGRIVDADGREVVLRGVNVNALVEYWPYGGLPTTFPVADGDPAAMAAIGWDAVRLLLSWSRVEPSPGQYDDGYLASAADLVDRFAAEGLYTIVDLHQDAWGPTLAAPPGTTCPEGTEAAFGWDGAPGWATLVGGEVARCGPPIREVQPAVRAAWQAFFANAAGPGGVGIRDRYAAMLAHVAGFFADRDEVAGIDLMNEPNAFGDDELRSLSELYRDAVAAIRDSEAAAGGGEHTVFFEPSALWASSDTGTPPTFEHDGNVAYAPHLYEGAFDGGPVSRAGFERAAADAASFGGVPVVSGEWGTDPSRAADPADDYFAAHQALQDEFGFGATLWTWRESCGDPHKAADARAGRVPQVWGLFDVDCRTNTVDGMRQPLAAVLTRGYVRAAPGRLDELAWDPAAGTLTASGSAADAGQGLLAWVPCTEGRLPSVDASPGLDDAEVAAAEAGGCVVTAEATGGEWSVTVAPSA